MNLSLEDDLEGNKRPKATSLTGQSPGSWEKLKGLFFILSKICIDYMRAIVEERNLKNEDLREDLDLKRLIKFEKLAKISEVIKNRGGEISYETEGKDKVITIKKRNS